MKKTLFILLLSTLAVFGASSCQDIFDEGGQTNWEDFPSELEIGTVTGTCTNTCDGEGNGYHHGHNYGEGTETGTCSGTGNHHGNGGQNGGGHGHNGNN